MKTILLFLAIMLSPFCAMAQDSDILGTPFAISWDDMTFPEGRPVTCTFSNKYVSITPSQTDFNPEVDKEFVVKFAEPLEYYYNSPCKTSDGTQQWNALALEPGKTEAKLEVTEEIHELSIQNTQQSTNSFTITESYVEKKNGTKVPVTWTGGWASSVVNADITSGVAELKGYQYVSMTVPECFRENGTKTLRIYTNDDTSEKPVKWVIIDTGANYSYCDIGIDATGKYAEFTTDKCIQTLRLQNSDLSNTYSLDIRAITWEYKATAPHLTVKNANNQDVTNYATDLGLVSAPASTTFTLKSDGGSAVVLKNIASTFENVTWTVDGAAVAFPYNIAAGETKTFTLTLNNGGSQSSNLTFNFGNTYDDAEYSVESKAVSAVVADPSLYLEDFESKASFPTGWCQPGWINEAGSTWSFKSSSNNTYAESSTQSMQGKYLISPKLTFTAGQTLTVSAVPGSTSTYSSNQTFLKVLYSTDRVNWEVAKVIAMADTRNAVKGYEDKFMEWGSFGGTTIAYAKPFVIDGIPAGDYYIGFESGYSKIDYICGGALAEADNDFYINSVDVATKMGGMANYPVTVTVNYSNMKNEASKAHSVVLLNDEDVIDEKEVDAVAAYTAADPVVFTLTPHMATTLKLQVKILVEEDSYETASAVIEKTIQAENGDVIKQVGENTGMTNSVIGQNYNRYRTEWIMKSSDLGLANGTEITSLSLKYYNTSKDVTKKAKIYLMSTEDDDVSGTAFTAVASFTPNFSDDAYVMAKAGSSTEPAEMKFVFDNPYTYDGKNIRIVTDFNGSNYTSINFETAPGKSLYYRADGSTDTSDSNSATSGSVVPVAYLSYSVQPKTFSGEVKKDDEGAAEGIEVVAKSKTKDVEYYATTGSDGKYTMNIFQDDMEYTLTVTKPRGYEGKTSMNGDFDKSNNFTLTRHKVPVSIGEHQYTTFYDGVYDMNIPEGWHAWTATVQGEEIIYSELSQYIPAGTGVLLYYGDITDTSIESATDEVENNVTDNVFFGYDADATPTSSVYRYYKLQYSEEENRVGFYWGAENGAPFLCKAHKAYIGIPNFMPAKMFMKLPMDDVATAINSATVANGSLHQVDSYNLSGQKVSANYKGLVIRNGKKAVQK